MSLQAWTLRIFVFLLSKKLLNPKNWFVMRELAALWDRVAGLPLNRRSTISAMIFQFWNMIFEAWSSLYSFRPRGSICLHRNLKILPNMRVE